MSPSDEPRVNRLAGQANVDTAQIESPLTIVLNFGVALASNSPGMSRLILWGRISAAGRTRQGPKLTCHFSLCFVMVILSTQNPLNCRTHSIAIKLCYVLGANHGEGYLLVTLVGCKQFYKNVFSPIRKCSMAICRFVVVISSDLRDRFRIRVSGTILPQSVKRHARQLPSSQCGP